MYTFLNDEFKIYSEEGHLPFLDTYVVYLYKYMYTYLYTYNIYITCP